MAKILEMKRPRNSAVSDEELHRTYNVFDCHRYDALLRVPHIDSIVIPKKNNHDEYNTYVFNTFVATNEDWIKSEQIDEDLARDPNSRTKKDIQWSIRYVPCCFEHIHPIELFKLLGKYEQRIVLLVYNAHRDKGLPVKFDSNNFHSATGKKAKDNTYVAGFIYNLYLKQWHYYDEEEETETPIDWINCSIYVTNDDMQDIEYVMADINPDKIRYYDKIVGYIKRHPKEFKHLKDLIPPVQ